MLLLGTFVWDFCIEFLFRTVAWGLGLHLCLGNLLKPFCVNHCRLGNLFGTFGWDLRLGHLFGAVVCGLYFDFCLELVFKRFA